MAIRIVITDDHAVIRSGLSALLDREEDFQVVGEAASGMDALRFVEDTAFDVLLLDISMPGMRGTKVAEQALKKKPGLAIVVLTMHADEHYLREFFRIGARAYVLKKSSGSVVVDAIRAAYRGEEFLDPALSSLVIAPYVGRTGPAKESRLSELSPREVEICQLLAYGFTNPEIADKLCISVRTVETHRNKVMSKLGLESRADLVLFAIDNGLMRTE